MIILNKGIKEMTAEIPERHKHACKAVHIPSSTGCPGQQTDHSLVCNLGKIVIIGSDSRKINSS